MVTRIYIVRHCEAEGNISEMFQGSYDSEITEKGIRQLEKLSERFKGVMLDAVVSSPLKRAYKTAQAVNKYHKLQIETDSNLAEINGGELEGHKWNELPELFPDTYDLWQNDFANFHCNGGESMSEVYARMSRAVMRVAGNYAGKKIAVVSHGGAIKNLLCFLEGKPLSEIDSAPWSDNTGVSCYELDKNFLPKRIYVNDCSHLDTPDVAPHSMWWKEAAEAVGAVE